MSVGIPFARVEIENGLVYKRCPECGERIAEPMDDDHKPILGNYQRHYAERHAS